MKPEGQDVRDCLTKAAVVVVVDFVVVDVVNVDLVNAVVVNVDVDKVDAVLGDMVEAARVVVGEEGCPHAKLPISDWYV